MIRRDRCRSSTHTRPTNVPMAIAPNVVLREGATGVPDGEATRPAAWAVMRARAGLRSAIIVVEHARKSGRRSKEGVDSEGKES